MARSSDCNKAATARGGRVTAKNWSWQGRPTATRLLQQEAVSVPSLNKVPTISTPHSTGNFAAHCSKKLKSYCQKLVMERSFDRNKATTARGGRVTAKNASWQGRPTATRLLQQEAVSVPSPNKVPTISTPHSTGNFAARCSTKLRRVFSLHNRSKPFRYWPEQLMDQLLCDKEELLPKTHHGKVVRPQQGYYSKRR
ncbi:hypothetical protein ACOSQ4_021310 [Xanthoceras sorbifolium]